MLKFVRFLIYGGMVLFILVAKAEAIRTSVSVLIGNDYFFDDTGFLVTNVVLAVLIAIYLAWLTGATIDGWKMPLWSQAVPLAALCFISWEQGWLFRSQTEVPGAHLSAKAGASPVERSMKTMDSIKSRLDETRCNEIDVENILNAIGNERFSGYRDHGLRKDWRVEVSEGDGPVVSPVYLEHARPGTIFLVWDNENSSFYLSAVVSDALPQGAPVFVVDGVGKPATLVGSCRSLAANDSSEQSTESVTH